MNRERFFINPMRKRRNPMSEEFDSAWSSEDDTITIGKKKRAKKVANQKVKDPKRVAAGKKAARVRKRKLRLAKLGAVGRTYKKGRKSLRAITKKITSKPKHRIVVYGRPTDRVWRRSPVSNSKRKGIMINPYASIVNRPKRRRSRSKARRNPALLQTLGVGKLQAMLPAIGTGILGAGITLFMPAMVTRMTGKSGTMWKYGSMIGTTLGGSVVAGKFMSKAAGGAFMFGSGVTIGLEVLRDFILPNLGMAVPGLSDDEGAYDDYNDYSDYGAFPEESLGAFPGSEDAYSLGDSIPY